MSTRGDGGGAWRVGGGRRGGRVRCPDHGRGGERVCGRGGGRRDPPSSAVDLNIKEVEPRPLRNLALAAKQNVTKMRHLPRPGYGRVGMECEVRSNHFRVDIMDPNLDIHHYHVAINPEVTLRAACRGIISQLVNDLHLGQLTPAYDGGNNLYTARPLSFESHMFNIKLNDSRGMEKLYDVTIRFVKRLDLDHLRQFLQGGRFDAPQEIIQALNIVLRQLPTQNYVMQSRSFFSKEFGEPTDIGYGLECWRGYYQSLHPTQMGLSLNIDISATTFYKSGSVIEFARDYLGIQGVSTYLTRKQHVDLKKALRGSRVEVIHRQNHRRRYKITGITREPLDELTFLVDGKGPRTSVVEYFQDTYHLRLRHVTWPCLQAGRDARPIYLPMEVCEIVGGQKYTNKLNAKQVSGISQATCQDRDSRRRSILDIVDANNYAADKHAREFGIHVVGEMASVKARVLPPPTLKFHDSGIERTCNPMGGAWNMINKKMVDGGSLERWACINFSFDVTEITVTRFCERLFKKCRQIGMTINPEPVIKLNYGNPHDIESVLREAKMLVAAALEEQSLQLLLIILPDIYGAYGTIKRVCETELDIVSQCCQPKNVQACSAQYMQSIAFKINVKVGGRNTALVGLSRYVTLDKNEPIIIFGADVTHPSTREDSSSSIAAVVASMDWPQVTKYRALVSAQARREEMIKDLFTVTQNDRGITVGGGMIKELLHAFYNNNSKQKPVRIIFYRDGVGEGQFNHALLSEVDAIKKACASIEEGYVPHITYVVVQKGHHTRFFPENNVQSIDTSGNILPGTVVDKGITHPAKFDFFLCSHAATKGTSRPAHYHVLWDENNFTADGLQTLTNNLCYTYACCTRSVSTVPPVYYAHLAAARARCYVEGGSEGETYEGKPLPRIKENVRKVMFYC